MSRAKPAARSARAARRKLPTPLERRVHGRKEAASIKNTNGDQRKIDQDHSHSEKTFTEAALIEKHAQPIVHRSWSAEEQQRTDGAGNRCVPKEAKAV